MCTPSKDVPQKLTNQGHGKRGHLGKMDKIGDSKQQYQITRLGNVF
jgi:hypothetical protein